MGLLTPASLLTVLQNEWKWQMLISPLTSFLQTIFQLIPPHTSLQVKLKFDSSSVRILYEEIKTRHDSVAIFVHSFQRGQRHFWKYLWKCHLSFRPHIFKMVFSTQPRCLYLMIHTHTAVRFWMQDFDLRGNLTVWHQYFDLQSEYFSHHISMLLFMTDISRLMSLGGKLSTSAAELSLTAYKHRWKRLFSIPLFYLLDQPAEWLT